LSNKEHPAGVVKTPETPSDGKSVVSSMPASTPTSGKKQAFDDVLKPLTSEELASPGTQKLVLYMLEQAQGECDRLDGYVERFHEADKRASIIQEKFDAQVRISKATEIDVITGTTLGGAMMGFASYFWSKQQPDAGAGWFVLICGLGLLIGSIFIKVAKK